MSSLASVAVSVEVRNALAVSHAKLATHVAKQFKGRGVDMPDLIQSAWLGLLIAAERFEPDRGNRFSSFAAPWIRKFILDEFSSTAAGLRIDHRAARQGRAIVARADAVEAETGRRPAVAEVVASRHPEAARGRLVAAAHAVSGRACPVPVAVLEVDAPSTPDALTDAEGRERLHRALEKLPREHHDVLNLRYGLDGARALTVKATAARLGLAARDVERLEVESIGELRWMLRTECPQRNERIENLSDGLILDIYGVRADGC